MTRAESLVAQNLIPRFKPRNLGQAVCIDKHSHDIEMFRGLSPDLRVNHADLADIDYETIIMYNGGYDDMVVAKTQIRARIETENAQREKKIAQLNEFIESPGASNI